MISEIEEWVDVPVDGFELLYRVSNKGRLLLLERKLNGRKGLRTKRQKISTGTLDKDGYKVFWLRDNGNTKAIRMHRLVAMAFIPNPENKKEINHINGIKDDNRVENLEWVTPSENIKHAYRVGLIKVAPGTRLKGRINEQSPLSIKFLQKDLKGNLIKEWPSAKEAHRCGFDSGRVCSVAKRGGTHAGFIWEYKKVTDDTP